MEIGFEDINSLAEKLEGLDLTEHESAILDAVLAQAAQDDVSGFASDFRVEGFKMEIDGAPLKMETGLKSGDPGTRSKKAGFLFDAFRL